MMDNSLDFWFSWTDEELSARLASLEGKNRPFTRHFTQEEDFFLRLDEAFEVPSLAIHHDVNQGQPSREYLQTIKALTGLWAQRLPEVFSGLKWFFDPRDILRPVFAQSLSLHDRHYLYLLRADLTFRSRYAQVLTPGSNDRTPAYTTRSLFLESELLPLEDRRQSNQGWEMTVKKIFRNTWRGESGRGYFLTGHWIDQELTKCLSKAFLAPGTRCFPFYPLRCRYNTLSVSVVSPDFAGRKQAAFVCAELFPQASVLAAELQEVLAESSFDENLPVYHNLRSAFEPGRNRFPQVFRLEPYLNEAEQKEYLYHGAMD